MLKSYGMSIGQNIKNNMNTPTKCPECGENTLYHNEGISKKNNKPYANNKCKCGYIEWLEAPKEAPKGQGQITNTRDMVIIDKLDEMNKRLDKLVSYLVKKLGDNVF